VETRSRRANGRKINVAKSALRTEVVAKTVVVKKDRTEAGALIKTGEPAQSERIREGGVSVRKDQGTLKNKGVRVDHGREMVDHDHLEPIQVLIIGGCHRAGSDDENF
jgi:hypothetical protein